MTAGCSDACRSGAAHRMPLLRGTHIHLCRLATYQSTPSVGDAERDGAGRVRAVGHHRDALRPQPRGDVGEGQHQRALGGDVIDDGEARARTDGLDDGIGECFWRRRPRHRDRAHRRALLARGELRRLRHAAVAEIGDEDLVAGCERKRSQHRVGAGGDVVDEHEVVAGGAEERSDGVAATRSRGFRPRGSPTDVAGAVSSRSRKRLGCRSISSRMACCAASTRRGVTPTVP